MLSWCRGNFYLQYLHYLQYLQEIFAIPETRMVDTFFGGLPDVLRSQLSGVTFLIIGGNVPDYRG